MNDKGLFKSQEQHSRATLEPKYTYQRRVKTHDVASLLTCPLCDNICKEATTINQCNHTFYKECIDTNLQGQHITCCPTCDLDLSNLYPDDYLRTDEMLRSMIETLGNSVRTEQPKTPLPTPPPSPTAPATLEPANQGDASKADGECGTQVKEQGDKKRKHSQLPSCQNEDEGRDETEHKLEGTLESNSTGLYESGTSEEKTIEDSIDELFIEHERRFRSAWFRLVPQEGKTGHFQPMLEKSYIYVKNGDAKVSLIKKLLTMRLNLENENKVEVCCFGVPLTEDLTFSDLLDCWMNCMITAPQEYIDFLEEEEVELMRLTYRRKKPCYPNRYTMFRLSSC